MIKGSIIKLRTIKEKDIDCVYDLRSDITQKGDFYHYKIYSYTEFINEFRKTGFWEEDDGLLLIIDNDENIVGEIMFFKGLDYQSGYEIGYQLYNTKYSGKGIMTEAVKLLCEYLFNQKPINRLQINVMSGNEGSKRIAIKCGFIYEGTMRKATYHKGKYHDLELYSLLREEFNRQ